MSLTVPPLEENEHPVGQVMLSRRNNLVSTEERKAYLESEGAKYLKPETITDSIAGGTTLLNAEFVIWLSKRILNKEGILIPGAPAVEADCEDGVKTLKKIDDITLKVMPCRQELERYELGLKASNPNHYPYPFIGELKDNTRIVEETDIAFWDHTVQPERYRGNIKIVSISHGWYTKRHIDPENLTLHMLATMLESYLDVLKDTGITKIAVFLDFTAFKQKTIRPKTNAERAEMDIALSSLNVWYAHSMCEVWLFKKMASEINDYVKEDYSNYDRKKEKTKVLSYDERGWTFFEIMISSLSSTAPMLDLGKLIAGDLNVDTFRTEILPGIRDSLFTEPVYKRRELKNNRVLPLDPKEFAIEVEKKTFTNKKSAISEGDLAVVLEKYAQAYNDITQHVTESDFNFCGWDKVTLLKLCNTLLINCEKLTYLSLRGNPEIDVEVANRLAEICVDKLKDMKIIDFGESIKDSAMPIAMGKFSDRKITVLFSADNVAAPASFELKAPEAGNTRRGNLTGSETLNDVTDTLYQAVDQMVEYTQNQERRMTANEDRIVRLEQEVTTLRESQASRRPMNRRRIANRIRSTDDNQIWS